MLNKIIKGSSTYTDSNLLEQVSYSQSVNTSTDLCVGDVVSANIKFATKTSIFSIGDEIEFWCQQQGENAYVKKGIFYVDTITKDNDKYSITAYDVIVKTDKIVDAWTSSLNDATAMTLSSLFQSICTNNNWTYNAYSGVNYNISLTNLKTKLNGVNVSGRSILQFIAGMAGGFIVADKDGKITIKHYTSKVVSLNNTKYIKKDVKTYTTPAIAVVRASQSNDDVGLYYPTSATTGQSELKILGNKLFVVMNTTEEGILQTAVQNIYNNIHNISYKPMSVETFADYGIECGDIVTVDSDSFYVMNKELSGSGCSFNCTGNSTRSTTLTYNQQLSDVSGKTASFKVDLDGVKSRVTDAEGNISTLDQRADGVDIKVAKVVDGANNIKAAEIVAAVNDSGSSVIIDADHVELNANAVTFTDLSTSGSTTINGNNITTGTVNANRIDVNNLKVKYFEYTSNIESQPVKAVLGNAKNQYGEEVPNSFDFSLSSGTGTMPQFYMKTIGSGVGAGMMFFTLDSCVVQDSTLRGVIFDQASLNDIATVQIQRGSSTARLPFVLKTIKADEEYQFIVRSTTSQDEEFTLEVIEGSITMSSGGSTSTTSITGEIGDTVSIWVNDGGGILKLTTR